ncbi:MAG TPA: ANTAR domain-containing protein [Gemmatimonadaceae bacterium]|jgi:two-component system, response regulator PdtaR|nr:ANTAR domain-containing protein [Gemmatimonadaceae bacterium]
MTEAVSTIRVLVAEDDENARALLVDLLRELGHEVVAEVGTGEQAIASARSARPDVVLLDVHMPGRSGLEAAEAIAHEVDGAAVVLLTGDNTLSLTDRDAVATSAVAFLAKPASPRVIDSTLRLAARRVRDLVTARREATDARRELENRKIIERAKGILMRRTGSSEQEAYRILQRTSQDRGEPMVDIARAVIDSEPSTSGPGRK